MWNIISILILIIEAALLFGFIIGRFQKRRLNETALFIGLLIVVNYSLHLVPFLYGVLELGQESNVILGMLDCLGATIKLFVGEANIGAVSAFAEAFPHFSVAYTLGVVIALLTTISTAIEAFRNSIVNGLLQTISMAIAATMFAAMISVVLAFLGSEATCPWKPFCKIIRAIASLQRNIPNMIWTFILIMSFGIGNVGDILALLIQSTGFMTRAFIETIDEIGAESIEAIKSVGGSRLTIATQALIPACVEDVISWVLYGLEVNIRSSTLVGAVGGGGIGLIMMGYIKQFRYHTAMGIILLVAGIVISVDMITNFLRKKVLV